MHVRPRPFFVSCRSQSQAYSARPAKCPQADPPFEQLLQRLTSLSTCVYQAAMYLGSGFETLDAAWVPLQDLQKCMQASLRLPMMIKDIDGCCIV